MADFADLAPGSANRGRVESPADKGTQIIGAKRGERLKIVNPDGRGSARHRLGARGSDRRFHAAPDGGRVMDPNPPMNLIVESDLLVEEVLVARELHPVHPQIRLRQARPVGIFGVDLRQGDERAAVPGPGLERRQSLDGRLMGEDGAVANAFR